VQALHAGTKIDGEREAAARAAEAKLAARLVLAGTVKSQP